MKLYNYYPRILWISIACQINFKDLPTYLYCLPISYFQIFYRKHTKAEKSTTMKQQATTDQTWKKKSRRCLECPFENSLSISWLLLLAFCWPWTYNREPLAFSHPPSRLVAVDRRGLPDLYLFYRDFEPEDPLPQSLARAAHRALICRLQIPHPSLAMPLMVRF